MRSFISAVALLVKVTAKICRYARGLAISSLMYSTARVNVLPDPADALYTKSSLIVCCCLGMVSSAIPENIMSFRKIRKYFGNNSEVISELDKHKLLISFHLAYLTILFQLIPLDLFVLSCRKHCISPHIQSS